MRQTVLNRTVLALLYKPCWPGLVQLTSAQFYDCLHCQTNWADPCWPTKMCQCKRIVLINMPKVVRLMSKIMHISDKGAGKTSHHNCNIAQNYCVSLVNLPSFMGISKLSEQSKEKGLRPTCNENNLTDYNR